MKQINLQVNIDGDDKVQDVNKEIKNLDENQKKSNKTNKEFEEGFKSSTKALTAFGVPLSPITGKLSAMSSMFTSLRQATNAWIVRLGVLRTALIATGIGAFAVALGTVASAFLSTQRGADALSSYLIPLQTVLSRIWGVLQDVATFLVDGQWRQAMLALRGMGDEINNAWEEGQRLNEMQIALRESTIAWITEEAELNRVIEQGREAVRDSSLSLEERQDILKGIDEALETKLQRERELIEQEMEIHKIRMQQNDDDIEAREQLAELEAELINLDIQRARIDRRLQRDRERLAREEYELEDERYDRIQRRIQAELRQRELATQDIEDERKRIDQRHQLALEEAQLERERREREASQNIESEEQWRKEMAIIALEYENEITEAEQEASEARIQIAQAERDARLDTAMEVGNALMALTRIAGEQTHLGKALGVASATIDTYVGANKALAQGGMLGIASATAIIATGLANVRQILSTEVPSIQGQPLGTPANAPQQSAPSITAPDVGGQGVNTVETIFPDNDEPVKAYVVETEITDTQNRVREIEESASF